jgi:hypothetical protein
LVGRSKFGTLLLLCFLATALATSGWVWLYALSGFILIVSRRLGIGIGWLNRWIDIENKGLSTIGIVDGVLVATAYWVAAAINTPIH